MPPIEKKNTRNCKTKQKPLPAAESIPGPLAQESRVLTITLPRLVELGSAYIFI